MSELTCPAGMSLVSGRALETDPNGDLAPFCIDKTEVTQSAYYTFESGGIGSKFELVHKNCATGQWNVLDTRESRSKLLMSPANVSINAENICGIDIREKFALKSDHHDITARYFGAYKPMVGIQWNEARAFCQARGGDLPIGKQWEKAARGPEGKFFGTRSGKLRPEEANYDSPQSPTDVGTYAANAYGLHDMAGNVWEWVLDGKFFKDIRGGSWNTSFSEYLRADYLNFSYPGFRDEDVGFRCVAPTLSHNALD